MSEKCWVVLASGCREVVVLLLEEVKVWEIRFARTRVYVGVPKVRLVKFTLLRLRENINAEIKQLNIFCGETMAFRYPV